MPLLALRQFPSSSRISTSTSSTSGQQQQQGDEGVVRKGIRAAQKYWLIILGLTVLAIALYFLYTRYFRKSKKRDTPSTNHVDLAKIKEEAFAKGQQRGMEDAGDDLRDEQASNLGHFFANMFGGAGGRR